MVTLLRAFVLTLFVVAGVSGRAAAFVISPWKWSQAGLGAPVTLTYSFSNLFDGGMLNPSGQPVPVSELRGAVQEALGLWASVAPLSFIERPDAGPPPSDVDYLGTGFPQIRFGHHFIGVENGNNYKAHAYYPTSTVTGLPGDVHFDDDDRWATIGTLDKPDVLGAALHELGHALGLNHSEDPTAVMFPTFRRMQGPGTGFLTPDDIAGIRTIYGAGTGSVRPLVPEPATLLLAACGLLAIVAARTMRARRAAH